MIGNHVCPQGYRGFESLSLRNEANRGPAERSEASPPPNGSRRPRRTRANELSSETMETSPSQDESRPARHERRPKSRVDGGISGPGSSESSKSCARRGLDCRRRRKTRAASTRISRTSDPRSPERGEVSPSSVEVSFDQGEVSPYLDETSLQPPRRSPGAGRGRRRGDVASLASRPASRDSGRRFIARGRRRIAPRRPWATACPRRSTAPPRATQDL